MTADFMVRAVQVRTVLIVSMVNCMALLKRERRCLQEMCVCSERWQLSTDSVVLTVMVL